MSGHIDSLSDLSQGFLFRSFKVSAVFQNNLVIDTPRVRKQTRLYSAVKEDELMEFSDLESDSEEKPCTKPRRPPDRSQGYARSECFRVEKNLLVYG